MKTIILILGLLTIKSSLYAHEYELKFSSKCTNADTIYYFADTSRVPKKDRIFVVEDSYMEKDFFINCSCLETKSTNIHLTGPNRSSVIIDNKKFRSLKLTSLADLIAVIKNNNYRDFGGQIAIFIILPLKGKYISFKTINQSKNVPYSIE